MSIIGWNDSGQMPFQLFEFSRRGTRDIWSRGENGVVNGDSRTVILGMTLSAVGGVLLGWLIALGVAPLVSSLFRRLPARRKQLRFDLLVQ